MSHLGQLKMKIPQNLTIEKTNWKNGLFEFSQLKIRNNLDNRTQFIFLPPYCGIDITDSILIDLNLLPEMWGTLSKQFITLLTSDFHSLISISGIGYKASLIDNSLSLALGFHNDILLPIPQGIIIECPSPTTIKLKSNSFSLLSSFTFKIIQLRPASKDPFKHKGLSRSTSQPL